MPDLHVQADAVAGFAVAVDAHARPVDVECTATAHVLGSGVVQDALGNVSLVLTVLDRALAEGAVELQRDALSAVDYWDSTDVRLTVRPA